MHRELAEHVLAHYRHRTGQPVRSQDASGSGTHELRLVEAALREYPDLGADDWRLVIERCLANPWWDDAPSVGAIFGSKVLAGSIANTGVRRPKTEAEARLARQAKRIAKATGASLAEARSALGDDTGMPVDAARVRRA